VLDLKESVHRIYYILKVVNYSYTCPRFSLDPNADNVGVAIVGVGHHHLSVFANICSCCCLPYYRCFVQLFTTQTRFLSV
jgi:hypothetical protein